MPFCVWTMKGYYDTIPPDLEEAAKIDGAAKVLCAEDALYGHRLAEPVAALIAALAGDYSHICAPATTDAKNILPRVAALLDAGWWNGVRALIEAGGRA